LARAVVRARHDLGGDQEILRNIRAYQPSPVIAGALCRK
jgi:hypothetical protein